ncbi:PucR family transcriptional regulator [Marinobacter sp. F3R11]|uniref:PucR family transcriptional regulator n=1 Tax=Marinobacter sp. F3R11 TaxID=2267231 RepID=UPI000DE91136|nr:PucR family transcriptional regulator [Marinobacter sp. F3R11]RBW51431.1 PucR family transcriptional regulator [Marinobacter sp. F3R11]
MALRCRDIPELAGLESIRLRAGHCGGDNEVRWPYLAENRSFRPWVKGGELVFVTGIGRQRNPDNLAECLYEGKGCGISGLVVLTGDAYIGQLPRVLNQLADELALPLFEQPYSLPMVEVTEIISRAVVSSERIDSRPRGDSLAESLVSLAGSREVEATIRRCLPGVDNLLPESADILGAWLAHRGNQCAMAEALGCHRNTIRNRMHRLAGELPGDRDVAETFKDLILAHLLTQQSGPADVYKET